MNNEPDIGTKHERREKKRERIQQHGKGLARIYLDAVMKRLKGK